MFVRRGGAVVVSDGGEQVPAEASTSTAGDARAGVWGYGGCSTIHPAIRRRALLFFKSCCVSVCLLRRCRLGGDAAGAIAQAIGPQGVALMHRSGTTLRLRASVAETQLLLLGGEPLGESIAGACDHQHVFGVCDAPKPPLHDMIMQRCASRARHQRGGVCVAQREGRSS